MTTEHSAELLVAVGASAGGLQAFKAIVGRLPAGLGIGYVLVQHLSAEHESLLGELLEADTSLQVVTVDRDMPLERDKVYVISPDTALLVESPGKLCIRRLTQRAGMSFVIDQLFESAARHYGESAAGILLSGSGRDGTSGMGLLHDAGGLTMCQTPQTADQGAMPRNAIEEGVANLTLDLSEIPDVIGRWAKGELESPGLRSGLTPLTEEEIQEIAEVLESESDLDIRSYKPGTLGRRVVRRMMLTGHDEDFPAYLETLSSDRTEARALSDDLLIGVTRFFRGPETFRVVAEAVLPEILSHKQSDEPLRIWVAGCSTGEETYSLAMLSAEALEKHSPHREIRIFGTDVDTRALKVARKGIYSTGGLDDLPAGYRQKYFQLLENGQVQIVSWLRDRLTFAEHNLLADPPFSGLDLISCRNLLIYFRGPAQRKIFRRLHFGLRPEGWLVLGQSETVPRELSHMFSRHSSESQIFQKLESTAEDSRMEYSPPTPKLRRRRNEAHSRENSSLAILRTCLPPTVLIGTDGEVISAHGDLRDFLHYPEGTPRPNLFDDIREDLLTRVRRAVFRCQHSARTVTVESDSAEPVRIVVRPVQDPVSTLTVTFESLSARTDHEYESLSRQEQGIVATLRQELRETQQDLQATIEELETTNEELRASGEESTSMNEELQSANQELEASSEELRSLNEELSTVNAHLRDKVIQLEQTQDDLHNFFTSTELATVFLDEDLRVARYTPSAAALMGLTVDEVGLRAKTLKSEFFNSHLPDDASDVLRKLAPVTREIVTEEGRWFVRRALPYKTQRRQVVGVVVTWTEVTDLKRSLWQLQTRERQQAVVAKLGLKALDEPSLDALLALVVREVQQVLHSDFCKVLQLLPESKGMYVRAGVGWDDGVVGGDVTVPVGLDSQAGYTLSVEAPVLVEDLRTERRFSGPPLLAQHGIRSGISCLILDHGRCFGVFGVHSKSERHFREEDCHFVQAVANLLGATIARSRNSRKIATEHGVTRALANASTVQEMADRVLEVLMEVWDGLLAQLWVPGNDQVWRLSRQATSDKPSPGWLTSCLTNDGEQIQKLLGEVQEKKQALWRSRFGDEGCGVEGTVICFPLIAREELFGAIILCLDDPAVEEPRLSEFLEAVGLSLGEFFRRIQAEQELRRAHARLSLAQQASQAGIWEWDPDADIFRGTPEWYRLMGLDAASVEPNLNGLLSGMSPEDRQAAEQQLRALSAAGQGDNWVMEFCIEHPVRGERWIVGRGAPVADENGSVRISGIHVDSTARKVLQQDLERSARAKDEFLAILAHELRNPLAAIHGLVMATGPDVPGSEDWLWLREVLDRNTSMLARLLDDLLDVSRLSRGNLTLLKEPTNLTLSLTQGLEDIQARVEAQNQTLQTDITEQSVVIEGDHCRLRQIFSNLLDNASKYTPRGGDIRVSLQVEGGQAVCKISDTGIGVERAKAEGLFEIFHREAGTMAGGLGIGLAITKQLVELHGGTVDFHSDGIGEGSTLTVTFPVLPSSVEPPRRKDTEDLAPTDYPWRTLVVDDNEDAAHTLAMVLRSAGYEVQLECRGLDGLSRAREWKPHLLFLDLGMPDIDGREVGKRLTQEGNKPRLMIAVTGYGQPGDRKDTEEAGFDGHLVKPVRPDELQAVLSRFHSVEQNRVLVVDDNSTIVRATCMMLKQMGLEPFSAETGADALEAAREHNPGTILLDLGLPDIDGFALCKQLLEQARGRAVRIIAVTGRDDSKSRARALEVGFERIFVKPLRRDQLERLVMGNQLPR